MSCRKQRRADDAKSDSKPHRRYASNDHHRRGNIELPLSQACIVFPFPGYYNNLENLEVRGQSGFMHARCPMSSPKACRCGRYACHLDSLIVAVDGACPGNGTDAAVTSACGVFFGDSIDEDDNTGRGQENLAWRVADEPSVRHTSQRAELHAAIGSLRAAAIYARDGGQWPCDVPGHCRSPCPITQLVIKSDSAYLVNGITGSIEKWASNGWKTSKKTPVKNRDLWELLLDELAEYKALGVSVDFWHVPRGENTKADRLANLGLLSNSTVPTATDLSDYESDYVREPKRQRKGDN